MLIKYFVGMIFFLHTLCVLYVNLDKLMGNKAHVSIVSIMMQHIQGSRFQLKITGRATRLNNNGAKLEIEPQQ